MLLFQGQKHFKEKEKQIPWELRLACTQLKNALKKERKTNSLRIKTCFH